MAAELSEAAGSLATPSEVNHLLSKTLLAFIAGRLPHKKAGMIGFLGQIILRTHREIAFHRQLDRELHPRTIIHDLPRPDRGEVICDPSGALLPSYNNQIFATVNAAPVAPSADPPSATQNDAQSGASPIAAPLSTDPIPATATPPPTPNAPEKIPDLSHFYPLDPRVHAYNPIPYMPAERLDDPVWPGEPPPGTRPVYRKFAFRHKQRGRFSSAH